MKLITIEEHDTNHKVIDANSKYAPKRQLRLSSRKWLNFCVLKCIT